MDGDGVPLRADVARRLSTPDYFRDPNAPGGVTEPAIAKAGPVYDNAGKRLGEVEGFEIVPASDRITRVIIRRGVLFHTETPIPAGWIASVGDRITLSVSANEAKELEPSAVGRPGTAHSR